MAEVVERCFKKTGFEIPVRAVSGSKFPIVNDMTIRTTEKGIISKSHSQEKIEMCEINQ